VGINTTNPVHPLQVNGTIGATEVIVSATGADYVFAPDYHLRDLADVSAYIQQNHHLPEIPSAAEVQEKGVSLGDMQSKLLAKVEELTLHMIQEHERNNHLEEQNRELQRQNREIQDRLSRLEPAATSTKH
jgi:predicted nuclease with TOPRIM domain